MRDRNSPSTYPGCTRTSVGSSLTLTVVSPNLVSPLLRAFVSNWCAEERARVRTAARSLGSPRPEGLPQLLGEERRLLERGEMAAFVEFIPIKQVWP